MSSLEVVLPILWYEKGRVSLSGELTRGVVDCSYSLFKKFLHTQSRIQGNYYIIRSGRCYRIEAVRPFLTYFETSIVLLYSMPDILQRNYPVLVTNLPSRTY